MVSSDQLAVEDKLSFYLAMHTVVKQSSTTTKLRIVFDASACSTRGRSLNDILLPGLNVYPHIMDEILNFRTHTIGMTADVSQMFRQIQSEDDRDLHRFLLTQIIAQIYNVMGWFAPVILLCKDLAAASVGVKH